MFNRKIYPIIQSWIDKWKTIILYGDRQTGKTTLVKKFLQDFGDDGIFVDCKIVYNREAFSKPDDVVLKNLLKGKKLQARYELEMVGSILNIFMIF